LNAGASLSCTGATSESGAASEPIIQQPAQAEPQPLVPGKSVDDILKGGDKHAYRVALQAGDFLHVVADQRGIDVVLAISGPDGKDVGAMDSLNGSFGPENVSIIAPVSGIYRIEVRSFDASAVAGEFGIRITELRPSKQGDEVRVRAEKTYAQGLQLYQGDDAAAKSAIPILEKALQDFQSIGDVHGQAATLYGLGATHQKLGLNDDVAKELEESIRLYGEAGSQIEAAQVLEALGGFQQSQGATADAEATYRKALDTTSKAMGTEDFEYARISIGLGRLLLFQRKYEEAQPYFERAIAIREKTFGPDSRELADVLVMDRSALGHNLRPLQRDGLINTWGVQLGLWRQPLALAYNLTGTTIGLVHIMLPFLVLDGQQFPRQLIALGQGPVQAAGEVIEHGADGGEFGQIERR